jgi:hypothetical protein
MRLLDILLHEALLTAYDIAPIALVIAVFQLAVFREVPRRLQQILIGLVYLAVGLTLFRVGLAESLIPIGSLMAEQLVLSNEGYAGSWSGYFWLCAFAALIGFSATMIEPTLIAIAERVRDLTGGGANPRHFRLVVAVGVACGLLAGTLRIIAGVPLPYLLVPLIVFIAVLVIVAPRAVVSLALDSGGLATSVVTVPLIAAFGIAVAATIPGRDPLTDGFGLIVLALLFPVASVLAFAAIRGRGGPSDDSGEDHAVQADHRAGV